MNKATLSVLIALLCAQWSTAQFWSATTGVDATGGTYLIAAAHVNEHVFVVGNNQIFAHSTDKGQNWNAPTINKPNGTFFALTGAKDRLYASMKLNNYDYELYYSLDNGINWTIDTLGLPTNVTNSGKASMNIQYMGDDYVIAYNATQVRYKELGSNMWQTTIVDQVINGFATLADKWVAIGVGKLLESTNHGMSWSTISTTGLPQNFQGSQIASNFMNRLFLSNAPGDGGEDIYFSSDGGATWTLTNSAGKYSHSNPWVNKLYAVDDYIFAAISPEFANFQDPPPYLMSSTSSPSFVVGDTSGFGRGFTTTSLPFFFHIGDQLYAMMGDLYTSKPGFDGAIATGITPPQHASLNGFPNPVQDNLYLDYVEPATWTLSTLDGILVEKGRFQPNQPINLAHIGEGIYTMSVTNDHIHMSTKLLKTK